MENTARDVIWPQDTNILVRVVILHVGQGSSAVVLVADDGTYRPLLIDINLNGKCDGINVPQLMADLVGDNNVQIVFVNTHPHSDHLSGITRLADEVDVCEVWHSGHKPGKKHETAYGNLQDVIEGVKKGGGTEVRLKGSRSPMQIGEAECYVLAPAEYVVEDIDGESEDDRYKRIHEQCAVLRFGVDDAWIMITGDADFDAWDKHIADYHRTRLPSVVLEAPHHGSRTFFCHEEGDEPYLDALEWIAPTYVVISAPRSEESQWQHPHKDAVALYTDAVGIDNVLHTGDKRHSFICDIFHDGQYAVQSDNGELADAYPIEEQSTGHDGDDRKRTPVASARPRTRIDHRPMGNVDVCL